jgi:hypothetical protein
VKYPVMAGAHGTGLLQALITLLYGRQNKAASFKLRGYL